MTESSAFLALGRLDDPLEARLTTGGHPMPGMAVRVVDPDTGADLPPGTPGELLFRGADGFDGYFRDPEATAATIDAQGWVHTGDVSPSTPTGGSRSARLKDMLKVGGENVAAAEIEDHLLTHPAVGMVAVVAAPDARYVEVPAAFVQLAPGASATAEELIAHCVGRIASFRVPRYVRFVAEWPMSGTKIRKFALRARIAEELAAAGSPRRRAGEPRVTAPQDLAGLRLPGGTCRVEGYENLLLHDAVRSPRSPRPHPIWAFLAPQRGMGLTLTALFETLGCPLDTGPLLGTFAARCAGPLVLDVDHEVRVGSPRSGAAVPACSASSTRSRWCSTSSGAMAPRCSPRPTASCCRAATCRRRRRARGRRLRRRPPPVPDTPVSGTPASRSPSARTR